LRQPTQRAGPSGVEQTLLRDYDIVDDCERFWRAAGDLGTCKVVWTSRRVAKERAGFLEWLWRMGEAPFLVIDLSEVTISVGDDGRPGRPHRPMLPLMSADQIQASGVLDLARTYPAETARTERALWAQMRIEDAPVRVLRDGDLAPAPITVFDALLMSFASADWLDAAFVVGSALAELYEPDNCQGNDIFLFARLRSLIAEGRLEHRGRLTKMRGLKVRLPRHSR